MISIYKLEQNDAYSKNTFCTYALLLQPVVISELKARVLLKGVRRGSVYTAH